MILDLIDSEGEFRTAEKIAVIELFAYETLFELNKDKILAELYHYKHLNDNEKNLLVNEIGNDIYSISQNKKINKKEKIKILKFILSLETFDRDDNTNFCKFILGSDIPEHDKMKIIKYFIY